MADLRYYDIIDKPVITEKSMAGMEYKRYTFYVHTEATKSQIKEAVIKSFCQFSLFLSHRPIYLSCPYKLFLINTGS